jgi:hypothetical protein
MLSANDALRHNSRRSMGGSSGAGGHSVYGGENNVPKIFKVLESDDEYVRARDGILKEKTAEEIAAALAAQQPQFDAKGRPIALPPPPPTARANACCFLYVSPSLCPPNAQTVSIAQETSDNGDADYVDFYVCDVASALGQQIAGKYDKPGSLPTFVFYYDGVKLEGYSGDSVDKFKICCKAAVAKRQHAIKAKEEAEKAAAAGSQ